MRPRFVTPPKITISFTNACNQRCRWCYGDCNRADARPELTTAEWLAFIDYLVENGFIQVYFEGGEPFHRPDFIEVLRHCARRMMTFVRTNGSLVTRDFAREIKRLGVGYVFVDIMGARKEIHEALTGVAGSFERACAAVEHLRAADLNADVLTILNRENAAGMQDCIDLAHRLGARRFGLLRLYPLGRAKKAWSELALSLDEQMEVLRKLRIPDGIQLMQSWHPNDKNCCWQGSTVNAWGDSIGCTYLREYVNFGNIRTTPFLEIWGKNPDYRRLREIEVQGSCPSCSAKEGTDGGCRSTAYAFHGRWDAPDPFCVELNEGVDLRVLPQRLLQESP